MTDDIPSWVRAASIIEGLTLSDVPYAPCERCGREIPPCGHPQSITRPNGSIFCFGCATLLHGSPQRQETLQCSICGLMDLKSIQEPFMPLDTTVEEE